MTTNENKRRYSDQDADTVRPLALVQVGWLRAGETQVHTICVEQDICEPVYVLRHSEGLDDAGKLGS